MKNAIDLGHGLGRTAPKVAILSAVEDVTKRLVSPVAGDADILVVPNIDAGNILAKQFIFLANADAAGVVLGARVPVILTTRADSVRTRMAFLRCGAVAGMPAGALVW